MDLPATLFDGLVATPREVHVRIDDMRETGRMTISDAHTGKELHIWKMEDVEPVAGTKSQLRLKNVKSRPGERLVFKRADAAREARRLPIMARHRRKETGRQLRIIGLSTGALASVVAAYIFGIPLLAGQIAQLIPAQTEIQFGKALVGQLATSLYEDGELDYCDPDPDSLANQAISRFVDKTLEGVDTPFEVKVSVLRHEGFANALALPGGQTFYFSPLLDETRTQDEFAGVLAHEIGHVVYRHSMQGLISTAGTGLLIGFVLGDVTGISVGAAVGSALINNGFSRDAERQADLFAVEAATRTGFRPSSFTQMLTRVFADDETAVALSLLSTHPLSGERLETLSALDPVDIENGPAFSDAEWRAISTMCDEDKPKTKSKTKPS